MRLSEFDYELPEERIAKTPCVPRDHSRLLVVHRDPFRLEHRMFHELGTYLKAGDLLVGNNTKVIPARVLAHRNEKPLEVLFLEKIQDSPLRWSALCRNTKRLHPGETIQFAGNLEARIAQIVEGHVHLEFALDEDVFLDWMHTVGKPPLPPYIDRDANDDDIRNYQTVYARKPGAVAAPTAGLHFTPSLIENLKHKGIGFEEITLHVGYGTFSPIRSENLQDHLMHEESYEVPDGTLQAIRSARSRGQNVIAVGTTSLRALESVATVGQQGKTRLFITPGFEFQTVTGLITNFHLPKSTLLVLVAAFLGKEKTLAAYQEAVSQQYRFFSYGDAMLILPT